MKFYFYWWSIFKDANRLIVEDPESAKVDYAFDNPAFKGIYIQKKELNILQFVPTLDLTFSNQIADNSKNVSPFDNKWRTPDKRKTVDDFYTNSPIPRLVPLRGSDFTGLGIEVCGGLKEGIYVKKVMPQGPAANIVHRG